MRRSARSAPDHVTLTGIGGSDCSLSCHSGASTLPCARSFSAYGPSTSGWELARPDELPVTVSFAEELGDVTYIHGKSAGRQSDDRPQRRRPAQRGGRLRRCARSGGNAPVRCGRRPSAGKQDLTTMTVSQVVPLAPEASIVGIDIGGTKTHLRLRDAAGQRDLIVPTSDWRYRDWQRDAHSLLELVARFTEGSPLAAMGVGAHGCDDKEECQAFQDAFDAREPAACTGRQRRRADARGLRAGAADRRGGRHRLDSGMPNGRRRDAGGRRLGLDHRR